MQGWYMLVRKHGKACLILVKLVHACRYMQCACRQAPFLVPFKERARVFQTVVAADRRAHRDSAMQMLMRKFVAVRRTCVLEVWHHSKDRN